MLDLLYDGDEAKNWSTLLPEPEQLQPPTEKSAKVEVDAEWLTLLINLNCFGHDTEDMVGATQLI